MNELENPNLSPISKYDKFLQFLNECGEKDPIQYSRDKKINLITDYQMVIENIMRNPKYKNQMTSTQLENLGKIAKYFNPECGPKEGCGGKCGSGFCTKKILDKMNELENSIQK